MSFASNYHTWILDMFRPYFGDRVVEVGAGSGNFSKFLLEHCPIRQLTSIEPSGQMFPLLQEVAVATGRIEARKGFFGQYAEQLRGQIDSALYVNVMEHVEKDQDEMARVFETLVPGGHLCIFVPALPFLMSDFDRSIGHYRRYTKSDLLGKLQASGFEITKTRYVDLPGVLSWYLVMVVMKGSLSPAKVRSYDRYVVPIMRRIESLCPPPIGKNLMAVARKPLL